MLDARIQPLISSPLDWMGGALARAGVPANAVTLSGAAFALAAVAALAVEHYRLALAFMVLCRFLDGLDGAVARAAARTDFGGYLDIVCDYVFYGGVPLGFAMARSGNALPAAALLASFLLTCSSFLAYAALAAKRPRSAQTHRNKSFFYATGLMEGTETIGFFVAMTLWPAHFAMLAWVCAACCVVTGVQRSLMAARRLR
jgi:phosphatidylglycerophosphate synthase